MAKYNKHKNEDLREFIGLLTGDTYFPSQLLYFDAITLADAIRYLQENNSSRNSYTPVNANNIYEVAASIEITNLYHRLQDIKDFEFDDMDISDVDRQDITKFLSHIDTLVNSQSPMCLFGVNANGLQDSQIYLNVEVITDTYSNAIYVLNEQTKCFSDFEDCVGYVAYLDEEIDQHKVIETAEDFKEYFEKEGWTVIDYSENENEVDWVIRQTSPAGEDFGFEIQCEAKPKEIVKEMNEFINSFDINEHVQLYVHNAGRYGVPPIDELVEDAKEIKNMLNFLAVDRPVVYGYETPEYKLEEENNEPDICE